MIEAKRFDAMVEATADPQQVATARRGGEPRSRVGLRSPFTDPCRPPIA
jgi:hypothetical protein